MDKVPYADELIDLSRVLSIFRKNYLLFFFVACITFLISSAYILSVPREYQATSLLLPRENTINKQSSSSLNSLSSLIPLAGAVGGTSLNQNATLAVEIIKSRPFFLKLIEVPQLKPLLVNAIADNKRTFENLTIYSSYVNYRSRVLIEETDSGFLKISYRYFTPEESALILTEILTNVDSYVRNMKISEAEESINFLNKELTSTINLSLQRAIASLVQGHIQTKLYASLSTNFIFDIIDPPQSSPFPIYPQRKFFVIMSMLISLSLSILVVIIMDVYNKKILFSKELPFLSITDK